MLLYCNLQGEVMSVPSAIPQGTLKERIYIMTPATGVLVRLRIKPPTQLYQPDIICTPVLNTDGTFVFSAELPESITRYSGKAEYQVILSDSEGKTNASYIGSFNISRGVIVNMPTSAEDLSQFNLGQIYELISSLTAIIQTVKDDMGGVGADLLTEAKQVIPAINELAKKQGSTDQILDHLWSVIGEGFGVTADNNITTHIEKAESDIKVLRTKSNDHEQRIKGLETETDAQSAEILALQDFDADLSNNVLPEIRVSIGAVDDKVSTNTQAISDNGTEIANLKNGKIDKSEKGAYNGVATLDSTGKVPSSQLPSYVDDVIEGSWQSEVLFIATDGAEYNSTTDNSGKIFVDITTNKSYRWSGTQFTVIASDLALGETSDTAYAGDKGKANADAIAEMQAELAKKENWVTVYTQNSPGFVAELQTVKTLEDFYKVFFDKRKSPNTNYVIQSEANGTSLANVIEALGGFPDRFPTDATWAMTVNVPMSESGGFWFKVTLSTSIGNNFQYCFVKGWNNLRIEKTLWQNPNTEKALIDGEYEGLTAGTAIQVQNPLGDPIDTATYTQRPTYVGIEAGQSQANIRAIRGNSKTSENLIPFPYSSTSVEDEGVTFTVQEDGGIRAEGTSTYWYSSFFVFNEYDFDSGKQAEIVFDKDVYFTSGAVGKDARMTVTCKDGDSEKAYKSPSVIPANTPIIKISIDVEGTMGGASEVEATINETFYPMLSYGTSPKPYEKPSTALKAPKPYSFKSLSPNFFYGTLSQGGYGESSGSAFSTKDRVKTSKFDIISGKKYILGMDVPFVYDDFRACWWDGETYLGFTDGIHVSEEFTAVDGATNCAIVFNNKNGGTLPVPPDPKLYIYDANNNLGRYVANTLADEIILDTEKYFPDGMNGVGKTRDELTTVQAIKRMNTVDLGTLAWERIPAPPGINEHIFVADIADLLKTDSHHNYAPDALVKGYTAVPYASIESTDKAFAFSNKIAIHDSAFTDANLLKTALNGYILAYPIADPVFTDLPEPIDTEYTAFYKGTEMFTENVGTALLSTPVEVETEYQSDLAGKLARLPNKEEIEQEHAKKLGKDEFAVIDRENKQDIADNRSDVDFLLDAYTTDALVDDSTAYIKSVPQFTTPRVQIKEIGGRTYPSENLIPFPYLERDKNRVGVKWTMNENGTVTMNGTSTDFDSYKFADASSGISLTDGVTYYLGVLTLSYFDEAGSIKVAREKIIWNKAYKFEFLYYPIKPNDNFNNKILEPMMSTSPISTFSKWFPGLRDTKTTAVVKGFPNLLDIHNPVFAYGYESEKKYPMEVVGDTVISGGIIGLYSGGGFLIKNPFKRIYIKFRPDKRVNADIQAAKGADKNGILIAPIRLKATTYPVVSATVEVPNGYDYIWIAFYGESAKSAKITDIMVSNADVPYESFRDPISIPIPAEVQGLPNYGKNHTKIDLINKQYIDKGNYVHIDENWYPSEWVLYDGGVFNNHHISKGTELYTQKFTSNYAGDIAWSNEFMRTLQFSTTVLANPPKTVEEWLAYLKNNPIDVDYETEEVSVTDISQYFANSPDPNVRLLPEVKAEAGGYFKFVNEHEAPVPSVVTYSGARMSVDAKADAIVLRDGKGTAFGETPENATSKALVNIEYFNRHKGTPSATALADMINPPSAEQPLTVYDDAIVVDESADGQSVEIHLDKHFTDAIDYQIELAVKLFDSKKQKVTLGGEEIGKCKGIRIWIQFEYQGTLMVQAQEIRFPTVASSADVFISTPIPNPQLFSDTIILQYKKSTNELTLQTTGSAVPSIIQIVDVKGIL